MLEPILKDDVKSAILFNNTSHAVLMAGAGALRPYYSSNYPASSQKCPFQPSATAGTEAICRDVPESAFIEAICLICIFDC